MTEKVKSNIGIRFNDWVRRCIKIWYEARAKIDRRGFYCAALHGESEYNISINSDMSVSCNCQDRGEGTLGYLDEESFEEIYHGEKAELFRTELHKGKLPILTCARCNELKRLPRGNALPEVRLPSRGLMLENTIGCNLDCPGCIRKEVVVGRRKMTLGLDELDQVSSGLSRLGLKKLYYFNRGEPFMSSRIHEEMQLMKKYNPDIHINTSTNGTLLNSEAKREAALMMDEIEFSIDGCDQESLERYQKGGSFERSYKNMKALVAARDAAGRTSPIIEWKYVLFRWNDKPGQIQQAIQLAKAAGVDFISFWPTNSPFYGISWRYRLGAFRNIGKKTWKGREVWFVPESGSSEPQMNAD
ncbi:radical SAM protein [Pontiellaceae bacterium B12227]|nr:radical SAM protein [Pontiellaceae bacterium B12227]